LLKPSTPAPIQGSPITDIPRPVRPPRRRPRHPRRRNRLQAMAVGEPEHPGGDECARKGRPSRA
jgi:hypothetical protein